MILLEQALARFRDVQDRRGISWVLCHIGFLAHDQGDIARACDCFQESLTFSRIYGNQLGAAVCLEGLAGVASRKGHTERAAQLLATAARLRQAIGTPLAPIEQQHYDSQLALIRAQLGEERFVAAWAVGSAMTVDDAVTMIRSDSTSCWFA